MVMLWVMITSSFRYLSQRENSMTDVEVIAVDMVTDKEAMIVALSSASTAKRKDTSHMNALSQRMILVKEDTEGTEAETAEVTETDQPSASTANRKDTNHLNALSQRRSVRVDTEVTVEAIEVLKSASTANKKDTSHMNALSRRRTVMDIEVEATIKQPVITNK
eukprot:NODE_553_length_6771_cov_0.191847.p5 type:complete len:164 gc:universal NODE_553_length_6771_cov_0.191847:3447-3938(+)